MPSRALKWYSFSKGYCFRRFFAPKQHPSGKKGTVINLSFAPKQYPSGKKGTKIVPKVVNQTNATPLGTIFMNSAPVSIGVNIGVCSSKQKH